MPCCAATCSPDSLVMATAEASCDSGSQQVLVISGEQAGMLAKALADVLVAARKDPALSSESLRAMDALRRMLARAR